MYSQTPQKIVLKEMFQCTMEQVELMLQLIENKSNHNQLINDLLDFKLQQGLSFEELVEYILNNILQEKNQHQQNQRKVQKQQEYMELKGEKETMELKGKIEVKSEQNPPKLSSQQIQQLEPTLSKCFQLLTVIQWQAHKVNILMEFLQQLSQNEQFILKVVQFIYDYELYPDKVMDQISQFRQEGNPSEDCFINFMRQKQLSTFNMNPENSSYDNLLTDLLSYNQKSNPTFVSSLGRVKAIFQMIQAALFQKGTIQQNTEDSKLANQILCLCQKVKSVEGHFPRDIQILSVIIMTTVKDNGRLAQIFTGEGKTLIVAMIAIIHAKNGKYVDIATSSEVLAIRDSQKMKPLYESLGVTVSHNSERFQQANTAKECYGCQVVYGNSHNFQADILNHEFRKQGTRGKRTFDIIIVDEVDNMLIDGYSSKTLLSTPSPAMKEMIYIQRLIWDSLTTVERQITQNEDVVIVDKDETGFIPLRTYLRFEARRLIGIVYEQGIIPQFRHSFVNKKLDKWIDSAIKAKQKQLNKDYIIENGDIKIVDYQNTGVVQENMHWKDGLHQYLQMKHNLRVTPENMVTNFLSNVGFFQRYCKNIYGLTGTLGSTETQKLLAKVYGVDVVFIPPFRRRQIRKLTHIIEDTRSDWTQTIIRQIQQEVQYKRAVLCINESISDVKTLSEGLTQLGIRNKTYTRNDKEDDKKITQTEMKSSDVILATNLAGRGTDFQTDQSIEANGGLAVIVTFLPRNIRIQKQAFGRTGRQGNLGTAQLILNRENLENSFVHWVGPKKLQEFFGLINRIAVVNQLRDLVDEITTQNTEQKMNDLVKGDQLFSKFCSLIESLGAREMSGVSEQIEESWAIFIEENNLDENSELSYKCFEEFSNNIKQKFNNETIIENPKFFIKRGLENFFKLDPISDFQKAEQNHPTDCIPYYYEGLAHIKNQNVKDANISFEKCKELINESIELKKSLFVTEGMRQQMIQEQHQHINLQSDNSQVENLNQGLQQLINPNNVNQGVPLNQAQLQFNTPINLQPNELTPVQAYQIQNRQCLVDQLQPPSFKVEQALLDNIANIQNVANSLGKNEKLEVDFESVSQLTNDEDAKKDLEELASDGLPKIGKVTKKKKNSPWSYLGMIALGIVQFVAGAAICYFSGGVLISFGMSLMLEGVIDIFTGIDSWVNGISIDWGKWGKQKVISLGLSLAVCGIKGLAEIKQFGGKLVQSISNTKVGEIIAKIGSKCQIGNLGSAIFGPMAVRSCSGDSYKKILEQNQKIIKNTEEYEKIVEEADKIKDPLQKQKFLIEKLNGLDAFEKMESKGKKDKQRYTKDAQFVVKNLQTNFEDQKINEQLKNFKIKETQKQLSSEFGRIVKNQLDNINSELSIFIRQISICLKEVKNPEDFKKHLSKILVHYFQDELQEQKNKYDSKDQACYLFEQILKKSLKEVMGFLKKNGLQVGVNQQPIAIVIREKLSSMFDKMQNELNQQLEKINAKEKYYKQKNNSITQKSESFNAKQQQHQNQQAQLKKEIDQLNHLIEAGNATQNQINNMQVRIDANKQRQIEFEQERTQICNESEQFKIEYEPFKNEVTNYNLKINEKQQLNETDVQKINTKVEEILKQLQDQQLLKADGITFESAQRQKIITQVSSQLKSQFKQFPNLIMLWITAFTEILDSNNNFLASETRDMQAFIINVIDTSLQSNFENGFYTNQMKKPYDELMKDLREACTIQDDQKFKQKK